MARVEDITVQPANRGELGRALVQDLGYDAWDVVQLELDYFTADKATDPRRTQRFLRRSISRAFWLKSVQGVIARYNAIRTWSLLRQDPPEVLMEEAFHGLSGFFGVSHQELSNKLDDLARACHRYLTSRDIIIETRRSTNDMRTVCIAICAFMRKQGLASASDFRFHDLYNHFPHWFLSPCRATIPISLVYVFVALARRLGFEAVPLGLPFRVLAQVPTPSDGPYGLIVDVYGSETKAILSAETDVPELLSRAGVRITQSVISQTLRQPATSGQMLLRAARNIIGSFHAFAGPTAEQISPISQSSAVYAGFAANSMMTPEDVQYAARVAAVSNSYPLDALAVMMDVFAPALHPEPRATVSRMVEQQVEEDRRDSTAVRRRSRLNTTIKYFVGAMFRHNKYEYDGVIVGWDPVCAESEQWMNQMKVDELNRGRRQPFYQALVTNGPSRYVAEENIGLIDFQTDRVQRFLDGTLRLGQFFDDVEIDSSARGRFISSFDLRSGYPEDETVADMWVKQGILPDPVISGTPP
ncbi:YccV-like-domain-containing protein [Punctularia strigosozonata HHB-11173 SS5]|uniref:YccV-like-domain-containing protein n=1 Tax=Punctularia strigosozonata (strain HHB-11173) TaxID=741275 RepID=UPI00044176BE|nr:YccV-like-domain-containing protein [Punctularia strigosozonata HHB-11173 SS5]EIN13966.1 YccV-like-domain-containing protein [Punctularia strigosozonata HHB-11173 SS5]